MIRHIRITKRFLSSIPYEVQVEASTANIASPIPNKTPSLKVSELVKSSNSVKFLNSISTTHFRSIVDNDLVVKRQMYKLLKTRDFGFLLVFIQNLTKTKNWNSILTQDEMIYFISKLVEQQVVLLTRSMYHKALAKNTMGTASFQYENNYTKTLETEHEFNEARKFVIGIRSIYGNLAGVAGDSIYARIFRQTMDFSHNGYTMKLGDYENLICLEYYNSKLDLVNKWFERLEYSKIPMSNKLWDIKLKMNGADPRLWDTIAFEFYSKENKNKRSIYQRQSYAKVLNDFVSQGGKFDDHLANIIYALGYDEKVEEIFKIIRSKYGINSSGEKVENTSYVPDIPIINAIVVGLSYNNMFSQAMGLVNTFQNHFQLDFSSQSFWDNLFKWGDLTTRYRGQNVLAYFIDNFNPTVKSREFKDLLNDPEFDYERYITFRNDLATIRTKLLNQVWSLYENTNGRFSVVPYSTHINLLRQLQDEQGIYDMLVLLYKHYLDFKVTSKSFNKVIGNLNNSEDSIIRLYSRNMRNLINLKFNNEDYDIIPLIIQEWSLNKEMVAYFTKHYNTKLPIYKRKHEIRRGDELLRKSQEDNKDSLLELF